MVASSVTYVTAAMALGFAAIHLFIGRLEWLESLPRNRFLSFAGGVAVSYVFLHVLPDLGAHSAEISSIAGRDPVRVESLVYGLGLLGLMVFFGLERRVRQSRQESRHRGEGDRMREDVLWLHIASFSVLNFLIGYLLNNREEMGAISLLLYFGAMVLHFVTADLGMRRDHAEAYDKVGRWIIVAAVMGGWLAGLYVELPPIAIGCVFAFVSGGIILNVLKEELPEDRESRFLPFGAGAALFGLMVIAERTL